MVSKKITLIQPRHIYAPKISQKKLGHIYMPTSLLTVTSILLSAGINVEVIDENIEQYNFSNNFIGLNLLGAPYIPVAITYKRKLEQKYKEYKLLLGGQVVNGLTKREFISLFGANSYNGNDFNLLAGALGIERKILIEPEEISLIPAYKLINDNYFRLYLSREQGFYLSQGCKYSCTFCAAKRTGFNSYLNRFIKIKEKYRNIDIVIEDLEYIIKKAINYGLSSISLYLSNLDLFQSPKELLIFALRTKNLRKIFDGFQIRMRGLSTVRSFLNVHKENPEIIKELISAGLYRVGFGIDGSTYKVYKLTHKPQSVEDCLNAIRILIEFYNLEPETLMVFGHNEKEDKIALEKAFYFSLEMFKKYGALPRPHVSKDIVPGNDGWNHKNNKDTIKKYIENPWLFQNMDFTAIPSNLTHPNEEFRDLVTEVYLKICNLPYTLTQYVRPYDSYPNSDLIRFNCEKYDI